MEVIKNSAESQIEMELERLGILGHFEFVISSADYGVRKPDRILFDVALRRLGSGPRDAWFVGDHVGYDMVGAYGAGLHPVAYRAKEPIPPSVVRISAISHWRELGPLVEAASSEVGVQSAAAGA